MRKIKGILNLDTAVYLAYFILPFVYFWRNFLVFGSDRRYFYNDFAAYFYPAMRILFSSISNFQLIHWDTTQYLLGMPFLARVDVGTFYPVYWIFAFLASMFNLTGESLTLFIEIMIILHLTLSGLFTYLLLNRSFKLGRYSSFIGGVIFMFSGIMIGGVNTGFNTISFSWLPVIFYFFNQGLESKKIKYFVLTGLFLGIDFLIGYPSSSLYITILLFVYIVIYASVSKDIHILKTGVVGLGITVILAGMLYAVQFIPSRTLLEHSYRSSLGYENASFNLIFRPSRVIELFIPFYYLKSGNTSVNFVNNYMGLLAIIGFASSFLFYKKSQNSRLLVFYFLTFIAFCFSLGGLTFVHDFAYISIPLYSKFRTVTNNLFLFSFCFAIVAAHGINYIFSNTEVFKDLIIYFKRILLASGALFGFFLLISPFLSTGKINFIDLFGLFILILSLNFFLFYLFYKSTDKERKLVKVYILALLIFDMFTFSKYFDMNNSKVNPHIFYGDNEVVSYLKENGKEYKVYMEDLSHHYNSAVVGISQVQGYQPLGIKDVSSELLPFLNKNDLDNNIYAKLGVKYYVFYNKTPTEDPNLRLEKTIPITTHNNNDYYFMMNSQFEHPSIGTNIYIYSNDSALPKAYLAKELSNTNKLDVQQAMPLLIDDNNVNKTFIEDSASNISSNSKVNIKEETNNSITVDVSGSEKSFLVVNNLYFPGWKAYDNGKETQIVRTNYFVQGVWVEPGDHEITFKYESPGFKTGLIISLTGLLLIIFTIAITKLSNKEIFYVKSSS